MTATRTPLALALLVGLLGAAAPAFARDVCVADNGGGTFVFQKVKKFKTGRAVALNGLYVGSPPETFPVHGSAVLRPSGNVEAGVLVHSMSAGIFSGNNFTASMQVTTGLEGTGGIDTDGDYVANSTTYTWTAVDCSTVAIP